MNKMKNTQNKVFATTRKDFRNEMNKMCYHCRFNNDGYCIKHLAKTKDAIGICSSEKNKSFITYEDKVYKMPNALEDGNNRIKKQVYSTQYYKNLRKKQLAREQVKMCQACSFCKDGWCSKTKHWCSNSTTSCEKLITLSKEYKLKKRKR